MLIKKYICKKFLNSYTSPVIYSFNVFIMKDFIKRISIGIVSGVFIWYVAYLFFQNNIIVQTEFLAYNNIYFLILIVIWLILFLLFSVYPVYIKMTKATLFVFGIALIIIWNTVLLNIPEQHIYIWDLVKVFWVVLTLLAWTNTLITDKVQKKKQNKKIQIIEV
jgi:hypothetical protein